MLTICGLGDFRRFSAPDPPWRSGQKRRKRKVGTGSWLEQLLLFLPSPLKGAAFIAPERRLFVLFFCVTCNSYYTSYYTVITGAVIKQRNSRLLCGWLWRRERAREQMCGQAIKMAFILFGAMRQVQQVAPWKRQTCTWARLRPQARKKKKHVDHQRMMTVLNGDGAVF